MVYAFKTHESSAGDTVGKLRWIAGKAMKSTSASSETAKMARLVMAKTVQGDERTMTMGAIRCSFLYISMSLQRGVVLGVYTPNRQTKATSARHVPPPASPACQYRCACGRNTRRRTRSPAALEALARAVLKPLYGALAQTLGTWGIIRRDRLAGNTCQIEEERRDQPRAIFPGCAVDQDAARRRMGDRGQGCNDPLAEAVEHVLVLVSQRGDVRRRHGWIDDRYARVANAVRPRYGERVRVALRLLRHAQVENEPYPSGNDSLLAGRCEVP